MQSKKTVAGKTCDAKVADMGQQVLLFERMGPEGPGKRRVEAELRGAQRELAWTQPVFRISAPS